MDVQVIMLLVALAGGLVSGWLGWNDSDEPFNSRKFAGTVARSLLMAGVAFLSFSGISAPTLFEYVTIFLAGYGVDSLGASLGLKLE